MAHADSRSFGRVIRERRRQLKLAQEEVARRIKMSAPYVVLLEADKRHPSGQAIVKLADVLGLDARDLFLLANPNVGSIISDHQSSEGTSAWDAFVQEEKFREIHKITDQEMQTLSHVAVMGQVRSSRDFIFILNAIRYALGR